LQQSKKYVITNTYKYDYLVIKLSVSDENNQTKKDSNIDYPSAKLLLDITKIEYEREFERANSLDTKVSIALTLSAALLVLIYPLTNIKEILNIHIRIFSDCIFPFL
jgi:hypothetical protein